jgi:hypothetical protein
MYATKITGPRLHFPWSVLGKALSQLSSRQRKTTIQVLRKWIPVITSQSLRFKVEWKLCPFCYAQDENVIHQLLCSQLIINEVWIQYVINVTQKLLIYSIKVPSRLIELVEVSVVSWKTTSRPIQPAYLHH